MRPTVSRRTTGWRSSAGGPEALDEAAGQYWLHLYLPEQPDLN
jgi:alpha-glucosidase